jgi:hypothetical protein
MARAVTLPGVARKLLRKPIRAGRRACARRGHRAGNPSGRFDQLHRLRNETTARFDRLRGEFQRLSDMENREISRTPRRVPIPHGQHAPGFAEQLVDFIEEMSGFGSQRSIPSRRISRINGVRSS